MMKWIISSSALILIVLALRWSLKGKISLRLQYALWGLVLLRLLTPLSFFSSSLSIQNLTNRVLDEPKIQSVVSTIQEPVQFQNIPEQTNAEGYNWEQTTMFYPVTDGKLGDPVTPEDVLLAIWLVGMGAVFLTIAASNLHFHSRLRRTRQAVDVPWTSLPVYVTNRVETPCLFGLFRPTIYLTPQVLSDKKKLRHVVEHEMTHYRHGDYIVAPLRCIALTLHWYNPLVWLAAKISRQDAELACDEGTIARLGEQERAEYGRTLIQLTCDHAHLSDVMLTATTMTGSTKTIKERIMLIAKRPKMAAYALIAVVVIAAIAVGCTFTGAKEESVEEAQEQTEDENMNLTDDSNDAVYFYGPVRVTIHYEDNTQEIAAQLPNETVKNVVLESMEKEYPGRSSVVNVDEIREIVSVPDDASERTIEVWKLKFSPVLDDDEAAPALEKYLVIIDAPEVPSRWLLTDYNCSEIDAQISPELIEQQDGESTAVAYVIRQMLEVQAEDLEQFQEKYQAAQDQLALGVQPIGTMPVYDPDNPQLEENRNYLTNGFYAVSLDPEIYGLSNFYVIPVGSREMTENEYLQLAEYSGLSAGEIVQPENSWLALQAEPAASNRPMSTKERFWMNFRAYEVFRGAEETTIQPDVPVTIYVGCGENLGTYTIYPENDMSAYALQTEAIRLYRYAPEEQQDLWWPTEEELTWEEAVSAAKAAMAEQVLRSQEPVKDYVMYSGHSMAGDTTRRVGTWVVALLYSDGGSYLVNLDSRTAELNAITRFPDGTYDFDREWGADEAAPQGEIVYTK